MPSLWKKQKGNRISRLVADLQSPPKRGGSLVVETGFPTSIVDLFVKNRDKLKKPSKKKRKSKQTSTTPSDQHLSSSSSPVSDLSVYLSKSDVPSWLIDDKSQENVTQNNNIYDLGIEQIGSQKNPCVELNKSDCYCKDKGDEVGKKGNNGGVLSLKNAIWLSVVKGALVVVVALYTKRLVVGITIGAFLLLLLEYLGNWVIGLFRPCEDAKKKLRGFSPGKDVKPGSLGGDGEGKKVQNEVQESALLVGSKRAKERDNVVDSKKVIEQEVGNSGFLKSDIWNGVDIRRVIEQEVGSGDASKGEKLIEEGNVGTVLIRRSSFMVDELPSKTSCEIEVVEPNFYKGPKNSNCCAGGCEMGWMKGDGGGVYEGEDSILVNHKGKKKKKGKKFWKKFVAKHIHKKKKHKHSKEQHRAGWGHEVPVNPLEEVSGELDEEYEQEDEQEMADEDSSSSSSMSSSDDEQWGGVERFGAANHSYTDMMQIDSRTTKSSKARGWNLKCLTIMGIALAGLIGGRIFALILTVICCLVFKMVRV